MNLPYADSQLEYVALIHKSCQYFTYKRVCFMIIQEALWIVMLFSLECD